MSFDAPNLMSHAGLVVVPEFAQRLGVAERVDAHLDLSDHRGQPKEGNKATTVLGGLLAGAESIDELDVLPAGRAARTVRGARRPPWTRFCAASRSDSRQLDARPASCSSPRGPRARVRRAPDLVVDVDSTICEVYGTDKQGGGSATPWCAATTRFVTETQSRLRAALPGDGHGRQGR